VAVGQGDGDERRPALGWREGEEAGAQGVAEGPGRFDREGVEGVVGAGFLGDEYRWLAGV
jgi:hypothetical protein